MSVTMVQPQQTQDDSRNRILFIEILKIKRLNHSANGHKTCMVPGPEYRLSLAARQCRHPAAAAAEMSLPPPKRQPPKYQYNHGVQSMSPISYRVAPTNFAYASVLKDLGRSIGAPSARSMMSCGNTPSALDTPNSTV